MTLSPHLEAACQRALGVSSPQARSTSRPTVADKVKVAWCYIEAQMRKGHHPARGEINGAIQRAFGPQAHITEAEIAIARAGIIFSTTDLTRLDLAAQNEALQAEVENLRRQLVEAQRTPTTQTGPTILSLIEVGCVVRIEPPDGSRS